MRKIHVSIFSLIKFLLIEILRIEYPLIFEEYD